MGLGLSHKNMDREGFMALVRDDIIYPLAADADYFSSATDGGSQAAVSITSAVVGDTINRSATGKKPLFYARRPTLTLTDASGTSLTLTVRLTCRRFGRTFTQDISSTGASSGTAVSGTRVCDEVVSIKIIEISNAAASDTAAIGFDGAWIGLRMPFASEKSFRMVHKIAAGTPDSGGPKTQANISADLVNVVDAAIDLSTLYSAVIAVTHHYLIEYIADGPTPGFQRSGYRFGGE